MGCAPALVSTRGYGRKLTIGCGGMRLAAPSGQPKRHQIDPSGAPMVVQKMKRLVEFKIPQIRVLASILSSQQ